MTMMVVSHHTVSALLLMSKPQLLPMQSLCYFIREILSQGPNLILFHLTIRTKKKQLFLNILSGQYYINMHKERDRYSNTRLQQQGNSRHESRHYSNTEVTVC